MRGETSGLEQIVKSKKPRVTAGMLGEGGQAGEESGVR